MPIKESFPENGSNYLDGTSDGTVYRTSFTGKSYKDTYKMLIDFLEEEGYGELPVPDNAEELMLFRHPKTNRQMGIFDENGFLHFPVKILFPSKAKRKITLDLEIHDELKPKALLRFHGLIE